MTKKPAIKIDRDLLLTPQEHEHIGGTPMEPAQPEDWFLTAGIGLYSRDELQVARRRFGFVGSMLLNIVFPDNPNQLGFIPGDIDKEGRTLMDPVIAERNPVTKKITERPDLRNDFYRILKEKGVTLHLHPVEGLGEGSTPGGEQKG